MMAVSVEEIRGMGMDGRVDCVVIVVADVASLLALDLMGWFFRFSLFTELSLITRSSVRKIG